MKTTDYIKKLLKQNLSDKRFLHSLGTADEASRLAKRFNLDENKAYIAGLVHDCAKNMSDDELLDIIKNKVRTGFLDSEIKNPKTYHAIAGVYIAKRDFEIDDSEILNSIRNHTIGRIDMSLFEKIIFLSDKIEPNTRDKEYREKGERGGPYN